MSTFLGLLGVAIFVVCTIALAAAVTWLVVRLTPPPQSKPKKPEPTPTPDA